MAEEAESNSTDSTGTAEDGTTTGQRRRPTHAELMAQAGELLDSDMEDKDWKAEAEKWKSLSRKHEDTAKANADAALKLKEIEDANLSEQEKLQRERDEARKAAGDAAAEAARLKAAVKHGLSEDDLDLLGDGTPDEIEARAAKLAARLGSAGQQEQKPPPVRGLGQSGDGDKPVDVQKLIDSIPSTV